MGHEQPARHHMSYCLVHHSSFTLDISSCPSKQRPHLNERFIGLSPAQAPGSVMNSPLYRDRRRNLCPWPHLGVICNAPCVGRGVIPSSFSACCRYSSSSISRDYIQTSTFLRSVMSMGSPQVATLPSHQAMRGVHRNARRFSAVHSQPIESSLLKLKAHCTGQTMRRPEAVVAHATAPAGCFLPIRTGAKLGSQRPLLFQPSLQVLVKGYHDSPRPGRQPPSDATPGDSQPLSGSRPPCVRLCTSRRGSVGTKSAPNSGRCATLAAAMHLACGACEQAELVL